MKILKAADGSPESPLQKVMQTTSQDPTPIKSAHRCSPNALGVAIGILWAAYVFFCGITAMFGWGVALVNALASLYIGYGPSISGAVIGAVWGFVDGCIAGVVIAWIYNRLAK